MSTRSAKERATPHTLVEHHLGQVEQPMPKYGEPCCTCLAPPCCCICVTLHNIAGHIRTLCEFELGGNDVPRSSCTLLLAAFGGSCAPDKSDPYTEACAHTCSYLDEYSSSYYLVVFTACGMFIFCTFT